jgi:aldehyde dehydrogenase (NAD+)
LIAAVAAGNCAILKPSELTRNTSRFLVKLVSQVFPEEEVAVVEGDHTVASALLALPFDHIFFTGSTRVGKLVAEAAAKNLATTTLELGGKSPVIIDETADLAVAAKRILWGKFLNAGQTCVAPDYVMIHESKLEAFAAEARALLSKMYDSSPLCSMVSDGHFKRLKGLTDATIAQGAKVEAGGKYNEAQRYIAPTLLTHVKADAALMSEEIFGPILPVLTYRDRKEVYAMVNSRQKPLALYVFSASKSNVEEVLKNTTAGGTCVNNTLIHLANPNLPFGGVGQSGMGSYHGFFGFKAFSHERAVLRQGRLNPLELMYPPYTPRVKKLIQLTLRYLT